jgi:plastocyanin
MITSMTVRLFCCRIGKVLAIASLGILFSLLIMRPLAIAQDRQVISITSNSYNPNQISVLPNTSVAWKNDDNKPHTVTSIIAAGGPITVFDSGNILPGETWSWVFTSSGNINYYDKNNPGMTGTIIVR